MNMEQKENRGILPAQKRYEYVIVYCFVVTTDNIQIFTFNNTGLSLFEI